MVSMYKLIREIKSFSEKPRPPFVSGLDSWIGVFSILNKISMTSIKFTSCKQFLWPVYDLINIEFDASIVYYISITECIIFILSR